MLEQVIVTSKAAMPFTQRKWLFLLILTLMSMAGLIGSDAYIPMLPTMGQAFHQNSHAMQLTLGIYFFGLSIGQLIYGPLTDSYGRKKLIIFGMVLYCVASIFCAFSTSYTQLLIFRFLQAVGACSGLIIGRAIVGDIFDTKEAGKIFSTIFPFVGMSPSISPVIGGFLGYYFGWQSVFIFISQFAVAVALLTAWYLPETLDLENRQPLSLKKILLTYPQVLLNKKFIAYASAPCTAYIAYFAYIAASPFIFYSHGFSERAIGTFYITLSLTYVAGNILAKRLLNSFSLDNLIRSGYIIFNLGGFLFLISGIAHLPLYVMVATISIVAFGNGFLIPLGTAGVISSFSKSTGYASGLLGFLQLGLVAVSTGIVGILSHNSILGLGIYIFSVTLLGLITFTSALRGSY
jgi:DHA1 family bicyclomycin/chloramphenicol resistance-like MFS transporter